MESALPNKESADFPFFRFFFFFLPFLFLEKGTSSASYYLFQLIPFLLEVLHPLTRHFRHLAFKVRESV